MNLKLKPVKKKDYTFLYELLANRDPNENISHKTMPTWEEHVKFNNNKPYYIDRIIYLNDKPLGRLYVTSTSRIGIRIKNRSFKKIIIEEILKTYNPCKHFINVSPKDKVFKKILKKYKYKKIQETYENIS